MHTNIEQEGDHFSVKLNITWDENNITDEEKKSINTMLHRLKDLHLFDIPKELPPMGKAHYDICETCNHGKGSHLLRSYPVRRGRCGFPGCNCNEFIYGD